MKSLMIIMYVVMVAISIVCSINRDALHETVFLNFSIMALLFWKSEEIIDEIKKLKQ